MTKKKRSRISDEMVAQIRSAINGREASRLTGVSYSHCKAIRRGDRHSDEIKSISLTRHVATLVYEMGEVTGDDLLPHCEGYTRMQVLTALQNANYEKLIRRISIGARRGQGGGRGSKPAIYGPLENGPESLRGKAYRLRPMVRIEDDEPLPTLTTPRGHFGIPRVASVWELGGMAA